ncbi:hypothetical protein SCB49_12144 [unidentified eubacterium SCB49]|nr:hypothetical protein SCB49_12144 [unidentified eubacterium SCB49]
MEEERFLVSGGIPRVFGELMAGHVFKKAELAKIDFENKTYTSVLQYTTPSEFCSDTKPSITFGCFCIESDKIYIPTSTQVLILDRTTYAIKEVISDPLFNDIHDIYVLKGKLYVAVTGLDSVFIYDLKTRNRVIIHVLGKDPFHKWNPNEALNKVASLKPHEAHPNHLFEIEGEIWVTRFIQKDAVCLNDLTKRIDIGVGFPHDGFVKENVVYFTTVNGYVVSFDIHTFKNLKTIKLSGANSTSNKPLGWCRGLYVSDRFFYVGFTQLRTTKLTENLDWARKMIEKKRLFDKPAPTRIEKYTLDGQYVDQFILPKSGVYTVFSIEKIPV